MNNCNTLSFGDAPIQIIDGDRGLNYPQKTEFEATGYCLFLNTSNVTSSGFNFSVMDFISKEKDELLRKGKLQRGDIVLTTRGTVGNVAYYDDEIPFDNIRINSGMVILRVDKSKLHPYYLYIYLRSNIFKNQVITQGSGSAQPQLPIGSLNYILITWKDIYNQGQIVSVISSIDSKIALNNRINVELEAMAKTVYDYWFVQFDFPNAEGKPYKSTDGKMVWSEELKREIPEGWEVKPISDFAQFVNGKGIKKECFIQDGKYAVYGSNGINGYTDEFLFEEPVIAIGRVGANYGEIHYSLYPCWISDNAVTACPLESFYLWWLIDTLKRINYKKIAGGSAQPLITQGQLKELKFVVPQKEIFKSFHRIVNPIYLQLNNNQQENQKLSSLRDWLLPMLMNGQVVSTTLNNQKEKEENWNGLIAAEPREKYGEK